MHNSGQSIEEQYRAIEEAVCPLKLDDSLLFLNHLLGVSRGFTTDPELEQSLARAREDKNRPLVLPHIVHFIAKQLLLHSSNLGVSTMTWDQFSWLTSLCIDLDDPIQHDPNWTQADPSGYFERVLSHQIVPQMQGMVQKYGLALGLFRDAGIVEWPQQFDLRTEIETEIGMSVETFMAMGHVAFALRAASHWGNKCIGTFTPMILAEAFAQGFEFCVPEVWTPFLNRVACTRDTFRRVGKQAEYDVSQSTVLAKLNLCLPPTLFDRFGFNPLWRFPVTNLGESRFLAVDPQLIVERVTLGLFYDLFERDRMKFTNRFGYAFDKFVGQLIGTVTPSKCLWSAASWEQTNGPLKTQSQKIVDWACIGDTHTVLVECKSLRPSLQLRTFGSEESLRSISGRIALAVEQLTNHGRAIADGKWEVAGLRSNSTVGVVVSFGRVFTANGPFTRKRVREELESRGVSPIPYVVLSIDELDMVIRLVELGHSFDGLIESLAAEESYNPLQKYRDELVGFHGSSFTTEKGERFLDDLTSRKLGSQSRLAC